MSPRRRRGDILSYNGPRFRQDFWKKVRKELPTLSLYILCKLYSNDSTPKRSKQRRDDMPPPMASRFKNRGGSTPVRGWVRSPHISGGWRWLSCGQPACI